MKIAIPLDENGMLPDRFGKYSSPELRRDGNNICSFPIEVSGVPEGARSLALSHMWCVFLVHDAFRFFQNMRKRARPIFLYKAQIELIFHSF